MAAATTTYKVKLTRPQVFLWRMTLFLILAVLLAIILDGQTQQIRHSFMANPGLNTLIIGVLLVGIVYAFRQVLRLYPEIAWVNRCARLGPPDAAPVTGETLAVSISYDGPGGDAAGASIDGLTLQVGVTRA